MSTIQNYTLPLVLQFFHRDLLRELSGQYAAIYGEGYLNVVFDNMHEFAHTSDIYEEDAHLPLNGISFSYMLNADIQENTLDLLRRQSKKDSLAILITIGNESFPYVKTDEEQARFFIYYALARVYLEQ